jgi:hypothetical protein
MVAVINVDGFLIGGGAAYAGTNIADASNARVNITTNVGIFIFLPFPFSQK